MVTITTTTAKTTKVKLFPKLMKSEEGSIVFFTEPRKGLLIEQGRWYGSLNMECFKDYNESITLKNK